MLSRRCDFVRFARKIVLPVVRNPQNFLGEALKRLEGKQRRAHFGNLAPEHIGGDPPPLSFFFPHTCSLFWGGKNPALSSQNISIVGPPWASHLKESTPAVR